MCLEMVKRNDRLEGIFNRTAAKFDTEVIFSFGCK